MVVDNFLTCVNHGIQLVRLNYPNSNLYQIDGVASQGPTTNPLDLDDWQLLCRTAAGGIASIHFTWEQEFRAIAHLPQGWIENRIIPWPISMGLMDAIALIRLAGYTHPFQAIALRWPLFPGVQEPFYIFGLANQTFVFVGVYTRAVMIQP